MTRRFGLLALLFAGALAGAILAAHAAGVSPNIASLIAIGDPNTPTQQACVDGSGNLCVNIKAGSVSAVSAPTNNTGAYSAATVGASSAQCLAASTATVFLDVVNDSTTATIAINFGAAAVINGAGSITLPPGWHRSWEGSYVPKDQVNCIASAGATPVTIGAK